MATCIHLYTHLYKKKLLRLSYCLCWPFIPGVVHPRIGPLLASLNLNCLLVSGVLVNWSANICKRLFQTICKGFAIPGGHVWGGGGFLNDVVASSQAQLIRYVFRIKSVFGISRFRILLLFEIHSRISERVKDFFGMSNLYLCHQLPLILEYNT